MSRNYTTFIKDENGSISHVVKHIGVPQKEVYEALRNLRDPHLPAIFRIVQTENAWDVEYEYIKGMSMENACNLEDDELLHVALDITQALNCIHSADPAIIHRDVKPANIVRRIEGGYVLIDFDAARLFNPNTNRDTTISGTEGYAAPEQFGFMQTDDRSDIYALGATLYELKTGLPYRAGDTCPGKLGKVIKKCTAFSPADRYRDIRTLYKALMRIKNRYFQRIIVPVLCTLAGAAAGVVLTLASHAFASDTLSASEMSSVNVPVADVQECICELDTSRIELTCSEGSVIALPDEGPAVIRLSLNAPLAYADECGAQNHHSPELVGIQLKRCTLGGQAEVDPDGRISILREGVYEFDAIVTMDGSYYGPITTTVIAAKDTRAYTDCRCVFDVYSVEYIRPTYQLPADGSPIAIDLKYYTPTIDNRLCTSDVHATLLFMPAGWLSAPEGSDVYVDENNVLHTTTPGHYQLDIPMWFGMREEDSFHYDIVLQK